MLTDKAIAAAKPGSKPYKLADQGGLYLFVTPTGGKSWRYDYRISGRRCTLVLGRYPDVPLRSRLTPEGIWIEGARDQHEAARALVAQGIDPAAKKKEGKVFARESAANTFPTLAKLWKGEKAARRSNTWNDNATRWLKDAEAAFGSRPAEEITPAAVLALLEKIKAERGARSAEYARQTFAGVFAAGVRTLRVKNNPARELAGWSEMPPARKQRPLSVAELPAFLAAVDRYPGRPETRLALELLLLTFVRKRELTEARWSEIDFDRAIWQIEAERMKARAAHIVPLATQALNRFRELRRLAPERSPFVFPNLGNPLHKAMGASTLNVAMGRIGFAHLPPHAIRGTASTILNGAGWGRDAIERQLAHAERDKVRAAYNFADYLKERTAMMQAWADTLDELRSAAQQQRSTL
ncbi:MAG: tyrosine-type recombinase/integrase [Burkholderiales bacterium]|nr:tyrosine-type recombinase/integrase [Burkholderiales bacterium]